MKSLVEIAKDWDIYYTKEGEPNNDSIEAMKEAIIQELTILLDTSNYFNKKIENRIIELRNKNINNDKTK